MDNATARQPGQILARGVCRALHAQGFVTIEEFVPRRGLRLDVLALGPKGEIWVIECKSCRADFTADHKWRGYLEWGDRYFWAVDARFPLEILPPDSGVMIADAYGGEILRMGAESRLASARRKMLTLKAARHAAMRLQALKDPGVARLTNIKSEV